MPRSRRQAAGREKREIESVASEIGGTAILADVTKDDDVRRLVDGVVSDFGGIDILVNNAARGMKFVNARFMTEPKPFWEADPDAWRMVIDTNITGVFRMTHAVVPHMLERGSGRIINISINRATMERKGFSPYGPSKAALESMSIIWAKELEGTLMDPAVTGPPAVYLASHEARDVNGRIIAVDWREGRGSPGVRPDG